MTVDERVRSIRRGVLTDRRALVAAVTGASIGLVVALVAQPADDGMSG